MYNQRNASGSGLRRNLVRNIIIGFVVLWIVIYLPSMISRTSSFNNSDDSGKSVQISFVCSDKQPHPSNIVGTLTLGKSHVITVRSDSSDAALTDAIATACGWHPPVSIYDDHAALQIITASMPSGKYIVHKPPAFVTETIDLDKEKARWERDMRARIETEIRAQMDSKEKDQYDRNKKEQERKRRELMSDSERRADRDKRIRERHQRESDLFRERVSKKYRQTQPPASDAKLIYPNPMRDPRDVEGNITFITGAININRKQHAGKSEAEYRFEDDYLEVMKNILAWQRPVQIVMQRKYYDMLAGQGVIHDQAIIRIVETDDLRKWKHYKGIEKIRNNPEWPKIASWLPQSPQGYSDLYNPVIMHKVYWMLDLCKQDPFKTKYYMWVDCGVCTTYLTPDMMGFLSKRYEKMMEPGFLATNSPRDGGHEIQGFLRWKLEEMAGTHTTHMMKGGTLGGTCEQLEVFVKEFDKVLEQSLAEGFLGTEESIYTIVYYRMPELFHEFRQERKNSIGQEALCLMNDRFYHIPEFGEKYIDDVEEMM